MLNMMMGVVASGIRSLDSGSTTVNVSVGIASTQYVVYRGGGTISNPNQTIFTTGSISPTRFSKDYEVKGVEIFYDTTPKTNPVYVVQMFLEGPQPTKSLIVEVQGKAGYSTIPPTQTSQNNQQRWWEYRIAADATLFNNWAQGTVRTVTLRWDE